MSSPTSAAGCSWTSSTGTADRISGPPRPSGTLVGGGVSERPKENASKAFVGASPPRVQIPPPPPRGFDKFAVPRASTGSELIDRRKGALIRGTLLSIVSKDNTGWQTVVAFQRAHDSWAVPEGHLLRVGRGPRGPRYCPSHDQGHRGHASRHRRSGGRGQGHRRRLPRGAAPDGHGCRRNAETSGSCTSSGPTSTPTPPGLCGPTRSSSPPSARRGDGLRSSPTPTGSSTASRRSHG